MVVLGAGPAGIVAALAARDGGARVTLVSDGPVGGRSGWHSLLPSKVLLHAATGRGGERPSPDELRRVLRRIEDTARRYHAGEVARLEAVGVHLVDGRARLVDRERLQIEGAEALPFDALVVATGSVPLFPPDLRPDGHRILAPRSIRELGELPRSMIVVGGGVTGTEFVHAFAALGVEITWVPGRDGVLPLFDRALSRALTDAFLARGIRIVDGPDARAAESNETGVTVTLRDGAEHRAEAAFVAVGRRPDLDGLGLDAAGVPIHHGRLVVDELSRTAVSNILAAGDATGAPMTATKALAQGWTAGRVAAGVDAPYLHPEAWIEAVFTEPELAQVGCTPECAQKDHLPVEVRSAPFGRSLRSHIRAEDLDPHGFVDLVLERGTGRILGARAFGTDAGEVLAPVALAIAVEATVDHLASVFPAYPTAAELAFIAARHR